MKNKEFYEKLEKYAEIGIRVGLNVQPGQRVAIRVTTANIEFSRALTRQAYLAGAKYVNVLFYDEPLIKMQFKHAPKDSFEESNRWIWGTLHEYGEAEDALLTVVDYDPDLLLGFDENSVNTYQDTDTKHKSKVTKIIMRAGTNRLAIGAATPYWAAKLFPETPKEEQLDKMWDLMFELARINTDDPMAAWDAHVQNLNDRCAYLNKKQYGAYRFTGPGTDLTVGMPDHHYWGSAQMESTTNILSMVNIPTEEIFCGPDRKNVNGVVSATKPLVVNGSLIDKLKLKFENGKVVEASAEVGEDILMNILDTDEGSRRLGEIALVPHSSPISKSGKLFYNTLYDENASSHLALGSAYRQIIEGGKSMTDEEFEAVGGNISKKHADFMVGSAEVDVDGITASGDAEPVMRSGEWAFEL